MFAQFRLTPILAAGALAFGLSSVAQGQIVTDVTVLDGAGNMIASDVRSFDENEAGSGLAVGFTPVVGDTFTFLYQANVVSFNGAAGQPITPGRPERVVRIGRLRVHGGREHHGDGHRRVGRCDGITTVTFATTGGTASIFYRQRRQWRREVGHLTGVGFDDGHLVGMFDVVAGVGLFELHHVPQRHRGRLHGLRLRRQPEHDGRCQLHRRRAGPDRRPALHVEPGPALRARRRRAAFTSARRAGDPDIYASTAAGGNLLLKVDGSNTFTTAIPEPETYALMLAGLGALGFMTRRRRRQV